MGKATARNKPAKPDSADEDAGPSSRLGRRDVASTTPAASDEAHGDQNLWPTDVEISAYELGIRLELARNEHRHADPDAGISECRDFVPMDIELAVYSFEELEKAFIAFADFATSDATIVSAGKRLIEDCSTAWKDWSKLPFKEFKVPDVVSLETDFVFNNLTQLVDVIGRMFDYLPTSSAVPWFVLGRIVGEWPAEKVYLQDDLQEEAQMLIDHLGLAVPDLFPAINENQTSRTLLPYPPRSHWRWFRIEAGLNNLKQSAGLMEVQRELDVPPPDDDDEAPELSDARSDQLLPPLPDKEPVGLSRPEYLGVYVDEDRFEIVRGDKRIPLNRQELLKFLQILIKNGESISKHDELINTLDTSQAAVYATKDDLDTELHKVGLQIENTRAVGYRLVELPAESSTLE